MTTNFSPEYQAALSEVADRWVPACGGQEIPFQCEGRRLLYCYNHRRHQHAYLDLGTDLILEPNELPSFLRA